MIVKLNLLFFALALIWQNTAFAVDTPASCRGVNLSQFMQTGAPSDSPPNKIYKFTTIRDQLLSSIDHSRNTSTCYSEFYRNALAEEGEYWGGRLAREGCNVNSKGQITGDCPSASEARKSTQYMENLDRELKHSIDERLEANSTLEAEANGARATGPANCPLKSGSAAGVQQLHDQMCCGTSADQGGVIRAVESGINYNTCIGKIRPTNQRFFSGGGLADCLGNAISAAAHVIWDSISSIFKLPGELWAARSQIWALITQPAARAQFAKKMMQILEHFFTDRVEAFKCYNNYQKAQFACKLGGQIIATCALPETMGAFLGLVAKPIGQAARLMGALMSRSGKGASILGGLERGSAVAARAARAVTSRVGRASEAVDGATGRVVSRTAAKLEEARKLIGHPLSSLAERAALKIESSGSYQRLFVQSFRAEKTAAAAEAATGTTRIAANDDVAVPRAANDNIVTPRAANDNIVTPRAANDNIVTPRAANDNIVTPRAANDNIVTPRAANDNIVTPRAANDNIVTPRAANDNIVTPRAANDNIVTRKPTSPSTPTSTVTRTATSDVRVAAETPAAPVRVQENTNLPTTTKTTPTSSGSIGTVQTASTPTPPIARTNGGSTNINAFTNSSSEIKIAAPTKVTASSTSNLNFVESGGSRSASSAERVAANDNFAPPKAANDNFVPPKAANDNFAPREPARPSTTERAKTTTTSENLGDKPLVETPPKGRLNVTEREQLKELDLPSTRTEDPNLKVKSGSRYEGTREAVETNAAIETKLASFTPETRSDVLKHLKEIPDEKAYLRDNHFAAILNSKNESATLARLKLANEGEAGRVSALKQIDAEINARTAQLTEIKPTGAREAVRKVLAEIKASGTKETFRKVVAEIKSSGAREAVRKVLAQERSALLFERTIVDFGDNVRVRNVFSANTHNEFLAGKGREAHSLENTFNADLEVTGKGVKVCRGSYATGATYSGITGGYFTICRSQDYLDRQINTDVLAAPFDTTLPIAEQGVSRYTSFEAPEGTRFSLGQNGPVKYNKAGNVIDGSGGGGGSVELFCSRSPNCIKLENVSESVRVPTCTSGSANCQKIFSLQEEARFSNVTSKANPTEFIKAKKAEVDALVKSMQAEHDSLAAQLASPKADLAVLRAEHPDLVSALNLQREIEVKSYRLQQTASSTQRKLDVDTKALVDLEYDSTTRLSEFVDSRLPNPKNLRDLSATEKAAQIKKIQSALDEGIDRTAATQKLREANASLARQRAQLASTTDPIKRRSLASDIIRTSEQRSDALLTFSRIEDTVGSKISKFKDVLSDSERAALTAQANTRIKSLAEPKAYELPSAKPTAAAQAAPEPKYVTAGWTEKEFAQLDRITQSSIPALDIRNTNIILNLKPTDSVTATFTDIFGSTGKAKSIKVSDLLKEAQSDKLSRIEISRVELPAKPIPASVAQKVKTSVLKQNGIFDARVEFASGEVGRFTGSREQLVEMARAQNVKAVTEWSGADHIAPPVGRIPESKRSASFDPVEERYAQIPKSSISTAVDDDLAGVTIMHGTSSNFRQSVEAGPRNIGRGYGGDGLYVTLDDGVEFADLYAKKAAKEWKNRTEWDSITPTAEVPKPEIMVGTINPNKELKVGIFEIKRDGVTDLSKGVLSGQDWANDAVLRKTLKEKFDLLDLRGAARNEIPGLPDRMLIFSERAGPDAIIWKPRGTPPPAAKIVEAPVAEAVAATSNTRGGQIVDRILADKGKTPADLRDVVIQNAKLSDSARKSALLKEFPQLNKKVLHPETGLPVSQIDAVINDVHRIGGKRFGAGVYNYTPEEIAAKARRLREFGIKADDREALIRLGYAGDLPPPSTAAMSQVFAESTPVARTTAAAESTLTAASAQTMASRATFTPKFVNKSVTTELQNQRWVDLASSNEIPAGTKFIDIENAAMKRLNDTTLDKNFVTALTNQHKQILMEKMKALQTRYPTVDFAPYSDFKSIRYAMSPKPPTTSLPSNLESDLAKAFKDANSDFAKSLLKNGVLPKGDNASEWFHAGFGSSADEASLASRYSRGTSGPNQLRNFTDPDLIENLVVIKKTSELYRTGLETSLARTNLMEPSTTAGKLIPRREVFDAARKTSTDEELQDFIKKSLGQNISLQQASNIRIYTELVDEFSPGIHVAKREVASLAESKAGGFSIDFAGLGSFNGQATADALARATNLQSIVTETRASERLVTAAFIKRKAAVKTTIETVLKRNGIEADIVASGDDMVVRPNKPIPPKVRTEIAQELADTIDPSSIRMSHVGDDISSGRERMIMATIGEACEKLIRTFASALVSPARLKNVLILVEVNGQSADNFSFNMVLGEGNVHLTSAERVALQSSANKAQAIRCAK
jgi:hypothetical protein